ncbi:MAG: family 2 glycosyl transferase [Candidatus Gottesmanbacteria bacterium GW2011_GWA2_43_14]|uniref:Family 2 glycosyl transferase n=1 Tax=Candidatus Gottesmanbacteria bacterium GW2011_GWA2_43_14 TaxID=1618443 RepID=A0A0G1FTU7_9BACT|nr:MAG: family 2 glycosyl transferase [Candidatus Gottesmanbacteria bacterium GW2011_GWA2_43_14]
MKIDITIIIPIYKNEHVLNQCLNSLKKALLKSKLSVEYIFIVNDPAFKKTLYIFPKGANIIFNTENLGFAKGINSGAAHAGGNWLLLVNADTVFKPSSLAEVQPYLKSKSTAMIVPKLLNKDGSLQYNLIAEPTLCNLLIEQSYLYKLLPEIFRHPQSDKRLYKHSGEVNFASGCNVFINKKVFKDLGGFDERFFLYFEDTDFCHRLKKTSYKIIYNPGSVMVHLRHQSHGGNFPVDKYTNSLFLYLCKYHSRSYVKLYLIFLLLGQTARYFFLSVTGKLHAKNNDYLKGLFTIRKFLLS